MFNNTNKGINQLNQINQTLNKSMMSLEDITENSGTYYLVISLFPLAIFFDFYRPNVNNLEEAYLKEFVRKEIQLLLVTPLAMLVILGCIVFLSFGKLPPYSFGTTICLLAATWVYPGYITLPRNEGANCIRYDVISGVVRVSYIVCSFSLYYFICALTGPSTFEFCTNGPVYQFPTQADKPIPEIYVVSKNNEYALVNLQRGYFTYMLYQYAPKSVFFLVMFYLSHVFQTAVVRCINFVLFSILESIAKSLRWLTDG